jgi:hypothetical protein
MGILPPQLGVIFTPGKEIGHIPYPQRTDSAPVIGLGLRVDQRFFIPSHDFMAKLAHNPEYDVPVDWYTLGEVYEPGKRIYPNMHLAAGPDQGGEPAPCSNTGEQELGIKLTHLILNRHEQCSSDWIHTFA